jgi:predicted transcriptional regulator
VDQLSVPAPERARKSHSVALKHISAVGQNNIATEIGVSPPTVSRFVSEDLERACLILAIAGLKVVAIEKICVDQAMYSALVTFASAAMTSPETVQQLVWEDS